MGGVFRSHYCRKSEYFKPRITTYETQLRIDML